MTTRNAAKCYTKGQIHCKMTLNACQLHTQCNLYVYAKILQVIFC